MSEPNTLQKGATGLARAIYEYQKMGFTVAVPLIDGQPYDLVIEKNMEFHSVQVRYTSQKAFSRGKELNAYNIGLRSVKTNTKCTTTRKRKNGDYDFLFVLCANDDCYSIPESKLPTSGTTLGPKYAQYKV